MLPKASIIYFKTKPSNLPQERYADSLKKKKKVNVNLSLKASSTLSMTALPLLMQNILKELRDLLAAILLLIHLLCGHYTSYCTFHRNTDWFLPVFQVAQMLPEPPPAYRVDS